MFFNFFNTEPAANFARFRLSPNKDKKTRIMFDVYKQTPENVPIFCWTFCQCRHHKESFNI